MTDQLSEVTANLNLAVKRLAAAISAGTDIDWALAEVRAAVEAVADALDLLKRRKILS